MAWSVQSDVQAPIRSQEENAAGHWDDCGPAARTNLMAAVENRAPTAAELDAIRNRMIAAGQFTPGGGDTMYNEWQDTLNNTNYKTLDYFPYKVNYSAADLRAQLQRAVGPIECELCAAHNLLYNEQGVNCHFVSIVKYDAATDRAYVLNGDRMPATGWGDWIPLSNIESAQIVAMLVFHTKVYQEQVVIQIEKDASGAITGAKDSVNGNTCGSGVAAAIEQNGWTAASMDTPEIFGLSEGATATVLRGAAKVVITYSAANGVKTVGGDVVDVVDDLYKAWQAAKNAPEDEPQNPPPAPSFDHAKALTELGDINQSVANLHGILGI